SFLYPTSHVHVAYPDTTAHRGGNMVHGFSLDRGCKGGELAHGHQLDLFHYHVFFHVLYLMFVGFPAARDKREKGCQGHEFQKFIPFHYVLIIYSSFASEFEMYATIAETYRYFVGTRNSKRA